MIAVGQGFDVHQLVEEGLVLLEALRFLMKKD